MCAQEKKTILLVEDEVIIALLTSRQLAKYGYNIITAHSGKEAIELATKTEKLDLILMDINLGMGIDGTEAAKQILSLRNIPIIFLTSHSEKEYVDRVRNITRYGYVLKDSNVFVLQSSIEMAFDLFEANKKKLDSNNGLNPDQGADSITG